MRGYKSRNNPTKLQAKAKKKTTSSFIIYHATFDLAKLYRVFSGLIGNYKFLQPKC